MDKIDKNIADRIIRYLIDISNEKLTLNEEDILLEKDEEIQEILLGLKHLSEDLVYNKQISVQATQKIKDQNEQLLKQNEELEHFAHIISHDLKAPLLGIHTLASFIEEDLRIENTENVYSHLAIMKKRIARMEKLIEGILDFSKIGMVKANKESIDLNELAYETYEGLNAPDDYEFKVIHKLPIIEGVRSLFVQLFSNLISNAIKFNNKPNGIVHIIYEDLEFEHQIIFKDNGPGIPQKYQEKIFAVFQTLGNQDSYKNTGIGLSIAKKIVTSLQGTISLKSKIDEGSEFIINFPK